MKVTINGIEYFPQPLHGESITSYYHKGTMLSDVKFPKLYTHGVMIDGYMVAFVNPVIIALLSCIVIIPIIIITILVLFLGKAVEDAGVIDDLFAGNTTIDTGVVTIEGDDSSVPMSYNAFMLYDEGSVDICFQNGDFTSTIAIVGQDISCNPITVEPHEQCRFMDIELSSDSDLFNAKLIVTQQESEILEYQVTIERFHYQDYGDVTFKDEEVLHE